MKKYKMYKKNELVKVIFNANEIDRRFNPKLLLSTSVTALGAVIIELMKSNFDEPYIKIVEVGSSSIIIYCLLVCSYEQKKKEKSIKKLMKLQEELFKQGIKVDFINDGNEIAEYTCDGIDYINVAIDDTNDIVCYQDGTVEYIDSDENSKDITDEVYKIILSDKKYKKYKNKKEK